MSGDRGLVLVTSRSFGGGRHDLERSLAEAGYRVARAAPQHDLAELEPHLAEAVGWIAGTGPVTDRHLAMARRLRALARYGVGTDAVDLAAAARRGIVVTNTPGANSTAVVELTLGLMLGALRGISAGDARVRRGDWSGWRGRELASLTIGVVGLGRIGRGVVDRITAFGGHVLGHDPYVAADDPVHEVAERADLIRMATECDVVSLHAPGGRTVVDAAWLARSDRPVTVVNTARADLVDEAAVAAALASGRVAAYAADTLARENVDDASPLLADRFADRVTVTPHLGAQTVEGIDGMGRMAVDGLLAVLDGRPAPYQVRTAS